MRGLQIGIKSIGSLLTVGFAYINHTLTPLFWALLILASLDVLLNVHKEGQQFQKIGSAFASIGGAIGLGAHFAQPDFLRVVVAVAVLAYLQVVVPQLMSILGKVKLGNSGPNKTELTAAMVALQAENERLKSQAEAQATGKTEVTV